MKKYFYTMACIISFVLLILLVGCGKKHYTINIENVTLEIGDTYALNPTSDKKEAAFSYSYDSDIIILNNNAVTALASGQAEITVKLDDTDDSTVITITVNQPTLTITGAQEIMVGDTLTLTAIKKGITEVTWSSSDDTIATVDNGLVTALKAGQVTITAMSGDIKAECIITINAVKPTEISVEIANKMEVGGTYTYSITVTPEVAAKDVVITFDKDTLVLNADGTISAISNGTTQMTVTSAVDASVYTDVSIAVKPSEAPKFRFSDEYNETQIVNYNDKTDILKGITAFDSVDGDITSKINIGSPALNTYGEQVITISVTDSVGNKTTLDRKVDVEWLYKTKFVGHAGCNVKVPNSEEAFIYAASVLKYQVLECDIQRTKDGIYICSHDSKINGMTIQQTNYADLKDIVLESGTKTGTVCTLERYYEICKQYHCEAIVEIKGSDPGLSGYSQDRIPEFINYIKSLGMYDDTIILCTIKAIHERIRTEGFDIRCQYEVNSMDSQEVLDFCINNKVDLSVNVTYGGTNSDSWLQKYKDAGIKVSTWTFSALTVAGYSQIQTWINKGVDYVTTDGHEMDKCTLK